MSLESTDKVSQFPATFNFPPGAASNVNQEAQRIIWRTGNLEIRPLVSILDTAFRIDRPPKLPDPTEINFNNSKIHTDRRVFKNAQYEVMIIGTCSSTAHCAFLREILGWLQKKPCSIIYLGTSSTDIHLARDTIRASGLEGHVDIVKLDQFRENSDYIEVRAQAISIWQYINTLVSDIDAYLPVEEVAYIAEALTARLLWRRALGWVTVSKTVFMRTWWQPICAEVAWWCYPGNLNTISFQHSIVTCPASFSPLPLSKIICFGDQSAKLIKSFNESFFRKLGLPESTLDCIPAGIIQHSVIEVDQGSRNILVLDEVGSDWAREVFGCRDSESGLLQVVENLAKLNITNSKLIIRIHPANRRTSVWENLRQEYAGTIEISAPGTLLEEDIRRSCICLGLYSTVLPIAALSKLAIVVLYEEGWYYTPDLKFLHPQFYTRAGAIEIIERCLRETAFLDHMRLISSRAGCKYMQPARSDFLQNLAN